MLELRTLRYFFTYITEGSITNAAKVLHITEPTLSRQLTELERRIGHELYRRVNKRIVLTQEGESRRASSRLPTRPKPNSSTAMRASAVRSTLAAAARSV